MWIRRELWLVAFQFFSAALLAVFLLGTSARFAGGVVPEQILLASSYLFGVTQLFVLIRTVRTGIWRLHYSKLWHFGFVFNLRLALSTLLFLALCLLLQAHGAGREQIPLLLIELGAAATGSLCLAGPPPRPESSDPQRLATFLQGLATILHDQSERIADGGRITHDRFLGFVSNYYDAERAALECLPEEVRDEISRQFRTARTGCQKPSMTEELGQFSANLERLLSLLHLYVPELQQLTS